MSIMYEIASKITLINHVSPTLSKIVRELVELDGKIGNINKQFDKMGNAGKAVIAGLGGAASAITLVALGKLAEKGAELLNQQDQLVRAGVSLADINRQTADAFDKVGKAVPTAQAAEYLKVVKELRGALGSTAEAEALAPMALKLEALLANSADARGKQMHSAFWDIVRGGEMKGIVTDPAQMAHLIEATIPWFMAQGGKLTPSMFKTFARGSGASWMNTDIDKALPAMMTAIADLSGPTAGKAQMSLYQFMMGANQIPMQSAAVLQRLGLMDSKTAKPGGFGKIIPGELLGAAEHYGDIPGWVRDVLMPAVAKEAGGDPMKEQQILLKMLGQNRNALRMAEMYGLPGFQEQIAKEKNIAAQVHKLDPAYQAFTTVNPMGVQTAFHQQFESMLSAIGKPLMIAAMPVMQSLTSMFTSIGSLSNANPQVIGDLGKTIAMLATTGGFASVGALIGLLFGPPGAAVGGLVGAMIGALTGFAAVKWGEITTGFNTIKEAIEGFWKWLKDIGKGIMGWVTSLGGLIKSSFGGGGFGSGGGLINASYGGAAGRGAYNVARAYDLIKAQGGTDEEARTLAAISQAESGGNPLATNFKGSDQSYGLWQINMLGAMGPQRRAQYGLRSNEDLKDPATNARVALAMHRRSGGYHDWSTYSTGKYRRYMSTSPHVPSYKGGGQTAQDIHVHTHLDGQVVANNTVRQILKSTEHSRGAAYFDGYGTFAGADRQTATA